MMKIDDYHDDDRDDDGAGGGVDCFYEMKVCFQTSLGFFFLVCFSLPSQEERSSGRKAGPWGVVNTTLHPRNGLNEPAMLHLSERCVYVHCVGGCGFTAVTSSLKLCPNLPSLE